MAITTEAFARALMADAPLVKNGAYVPQTSHHLTGAAAQIWAELCLLLEPYFAGERCESMLGGSNVLSHVLKRC